MGGRHASTHHLCIHSIHPSIHRRTEMEWRRGARRANCCMWAIYAARELLPASTLNGPIRLTEGLCGRTLYWLPLKDRFIQQKEFPTPNLLLSMEFPSRHQQNKSDTIGDQDDLH